MATLWAAFHARSQGAPDGQHRRWDRSPTLLLLCLLCVCLVAFGGCGSAATTQLARSASAFGFLFSDATSLAYLSWKEDSAGRVSGQEVRASAVMPLTAHSVPARLTALVSGEDANRLIAFQATEGGATRAFTATLTGSVLRVNATDDSGRVVTQQWARATMQDYSAALSAFTASLQVRGALADLAQTVRHLPPDSDPASLNAPVAQTGKYVQMLQTKLAQMQASTTQAQRCQQLGLFSQYYPAPPELFQLPYAPEGGVLFHALQAVLARWGQAKARALPRPVGLTPPWLLSAQAVTGASAPGQQDYNTLLKTYTSDQQEMARLHTDYLHVGDAVSTIQRGC